MGEYICSLCPRNCHAVRTEEGGQGVCRMGILPKVARAAPHFWEEPCISGTKGSGTIFFSGCVLSCVFCQNYCISQEHHGKTMTVEGLIQLMRHLVGQGVHNINFVSPTPYAESIIEALTQYRPPVPVVYNTGGYEKTETLRRLEGLVDVYLPDLKYIRPEVSAKYSHAADYPDIAKAAIAEMVRQAGEPAFYPEQPRRAAEPAICSGDPRPDHPSGKQECPKKEGRPLLIKKGVIVRHLLLPGHVAEAKKIIAYLHDTYGERIYLSILNQYTPMPQVCGHPLLGRRTTRREYERLVDYAIEIGVEYGFIQEGGTQKESFIPAWNGKGILPKSGGAGIFPE